MTTHLAERTSKPARLASRVVPAGFRISPVVTGAGALFIPMVIYFATQSQQFLTTRNASVIATQVAVLGIVSLGQMLVLLSGGFDLSISGVVPLAAVTYVSTANAGLPIPLAIVVTIGCGAIIGLINGLIVTKLQVNPLIATLGMMSIGQGLAFVITDGRTVAMSTDGAGFIASPTPLGVPLFVLVFFLVVVALFIYLRWSVPGRALYAVGGGREAAQLAGMPADRVRCGAFILSAALSSLAGIIVSSQLLAGSPGIGADMTLTSITAAVLGGVALHGGAGGVLGTLLGIVIIGTLRNGLALLEVSSFYQLIVTGAVLLVAVSAAQLRFSRLRARRRARATTTHLEEPT